jgi:hypothetical protein
MATRGQVAMPLENRVRTYQQPQSAQCRPREPVQQRRKQRPIGRFEPDPLLAKVALQHRDLVTQREDLGVLVPITAREQPQHCEGIRDPEVRQSKQHKAASSRSHRRRRAMDDPGQTKIGNCGPM